VLVFQGKGAVLLRIRRAGKIQPLASKFISGSLVNDRPRYFQFSGTKFLQVEVVKMFFSLFAASTFAQNCLDLRDLCLIIPLSAGNFNYEGTRASAPGA
jgi:hypothetical protein